MSSKTEKEWAEEFEYQLLEVRKQALRQVRGVFKTLATMEGLTGNALISRARGMLQQIKAIVDVDARQDEETLELRVQIHLRLPSRETLDIVDLTISDEEIGQDSVPLAVSRGKVY